MAAPPTRSTRCRCRRTTGAPTSVRSGHGCWPPRTSSTRTASSRPASTSSRSAEPVDEPLDAVQDALQAELEAVVALPVPVEDAGAHHDGQRGVAVLLVEDQPGFRAVRRLARALLRGVHRRL